MNLNFLVWLLLASIWGSTWLVIRIGLADLPPFTFAGLRFLIAAVPLCAIVATRRIPLPRDRSDWVLMLWTGFLVITLNYALIFWAELYITSGLSAILYCTMPLFGQVLAHRRIPAERLTVPRLTGVLLGLAGIGLIFFHELHVEGTRGMLGCAAVLLASIATAHSGILVKQKAGHLNPMVLTTVQIVSGIVPLLALGLVVEGNPFNIHWTTRGVLSLFYLALMGSSLTFALLYWLYRRIPVTQTQLIPLFSTLLAVLLGAAVLNEGLSWRTAVGGLAILSGLVVAARAKPRAAVG